MKEFYIGYLPSAPPAIRRRVGILVGLIVLFGVASGALFAVAQSGFAKSYFEFGKPREFTGVLRRHPFPTLVADDTIREGSSSPSVYLLVAPGKFGADSLVGGKDDWHVRLRGTRIHRTEGEMIEIEPGSIVETPDSRTSASLERDLGYARLSGEIVDTKCYLGVMNPGEGKVHRECAALCLRGGIPPALVSSDLDGKPRLFILIGPEGEPMAKEDYLQRVGQPVSMEGRIVEKDQLYYLQADPASIVALP
ncbi:MAG TPA: hypothetical protein VL128_11200 [Candidatus Eisenbacteria bacterium]|nr:hypothetical protein [Candidatus Eisenbacteria bacterium]